MRWRSFRGLMLLGAWLFVDVGESLTLSPARLLDYGHLAAAVTEEPSQPNMPNAPIVRRDWVEADHELWVIVRQVEEHPELAVAGRRVRHHVGRLDVEALCGWPKPTHALGNKR